jgi:excisionase family DNA binding protein
MTAGRLAGKLLTVPDAADILGISPDALRRCISAGEVQYVNVGSTRRPRIRITPAALEAFIEKRTSSTPSRSAS